MADSREILLPLWRKDVARSLGPNRSFFCLWGHDQVSIRSATLSAHASNHVLHKLPWVRNKADKAQRRPARRAARLGDAVPHYLSSWRRSLYRQDWTPHGRFPCNSHVFSNVDAPKNRIWQYFVNIGLCNTRNSVSIWVFHIWGIARQIVRGLTPSSLTSQISYENWCIGTA